MLLNDYAKMVHEANQKWWVNLDTGERLERNKAEMIALMHSELSEMLEAIRKDLPDSHLPHLPGENVELADLLIRLLDYAGGFGIDLDQAFQQKMAYNWTRADHSLESRKARHGKKF